ncbi:hypothetical protein ABFS82_02G048000 [Erythranthe guttata]
MNPSDQNNNPGENSNNPNPQRKGKGRQKIKMEKIENETNLQVTFSKRRAGLFKKASELSTLCGAESGIVVFSPGDKPHSYGNPSVNAVVDRFLNLNPNPNPNPNPIPGSEADRLEREVAARAEADMRRRNKAVGKWEADLKIEKERKKAHEKLRKAPESERWRPPNFDDLNYQQLDELKRSILDFQQSLDNKLDQDEAASLAALDNTNIQGPSNNNAPLIQGPINNNAPLIQGPINNNAPLIVQGGPLNIPPAQFVGGVGTSNNPGANAAFGPPFLPGYAPIYPTVNNNLPFEFPYNYGNLGEIVGQPNVGVGGSGVDAEGNPGEMQPNNNVQNMPPGFDGNYGHGNYFP